MPPKTIDIFERIHTAYHELTAAERKVADYVLTAKAAVQFMSITQLAEECGVADATVSRFCRTLELKGFNAFKIELAKCSVSMQSAASRSVSADSPTGRQAEVQRLAEEAIQQTTKLISSDSVRKAVTLLERAERILCMGSGGSMIMAQACAHQFSTVTNRFFAISESHSQLSAAATAGKKDVIILFSYSGATTIGLQILELAKSRGVKIILVTRFVKSPAANLADVVLFCGANEGPFQLGSGPAKIAQLVVVDILYHEYCHQNQDACDAHMERIASALSESHL